MQILISGVSSFLGKAAARELLRYGHQVMGVVRPGSPREAELHGEGLEGLRILHFDFDSLPGIEEADYSELFREVFPEGGKVVDAWLHFAWDGVGSRGRQDRGIQRRNVENAKKAYRMAELLGVQSFLFAGSQAEYGKGNHEKPAPVSEYGKAKLRFGEWARQQESAMHFLHLRIYSVYGFGDHPTTLTNTLVRACVTGEELSLGPCTQNWNYLEIRDFTAAISLLLEKEAGAGVYDIAGEETRALKDYVLEGAAALLSERAPKEGFMLHFGVRENNAEGNAGMSPDIRELKKLGFRQAIPFREGILELGRRLSMEKMRAAEET